MARRRVGPWTDVPDQTGRRIVVTGASSGVGLATAEILASRGADVVLAVRSPQRGEAAADAVRRRARGGRVEVGQVDVSSIASVRAFAETLDSLDVLIANAGVLGLPLTRSAEGHEMHLATNHLGHFALANLLLPRLRDRVVVVGSLSHRNGDPDPTDLDWERRDYRSYQAYADSKLVNLLFLAELQRRLTASGSTLRVTGAHPGNTATHITGGRGDGPLTRAAGLGHALVGMPPWRGALPTVYAATVDLPGNSYLGPHLPGGMWGWPTTVGRSRAAADADLAKAVWAASEDLTGVGYPW